MNLTSRWYYFAWAIVATIIINVLLFTGMPLMTQVSERRRSEVVEMPILIANIKPPKPPEQMKERQLEERKLQAPPDKQKTEVQSKPKSDGSQFEFAGKMGVGGIGISVGMSSMASIKDMKSDLQKIEFEISDVDSPPLVLSKTPAVYPFAAKRQGIRGTVVIRCLIGLDGKPDKLKVFSSEPPGVFDEAALTAVEKWRFKPGVLGGEHVPTWVRIPLKFELD